jgi:hypothetical protein
MVVTRVPFGAQRRRKIQFSVLAGMSDLAGTSTTRGLVGITIEVLVSKGIRKQGEDATLVGLHLRGGESGERMSCP